MKTLNLVDQDKSDIKYTISKFPDGQQQVTIDKSSTMIKTFLEKGIHIPYSTCTIQSRLNNFQDLEIITCAAKSLRSLGVKRLHLYTPC